MRVVADTNIFISALLFGGRPGEFLHEALVGSFRIVTSPVLLAELDEKLRGKFALSDADALATRALLEELCDVVSTIESLHVVEADPDDDRVLECAVAGHADSIVTGDRHLLDLGVYQRIEVLTVRAFMDRLHPSS